MDIGVYLIWAVIAVLQIILAIRHDELIKGYRLYGLSCFFSVLTLVLMALSAAFLGLALSDNRLVFPGVVFHGLAVASMAVAVAAMFLSLDVINQQRGQSVDRSPRPDRTGPKRSVEADRAYSKMYFAKKREVKRLQERIEELEALVEGCQDRDEEVVESD